MADSGLADVETRINAVEAEITQVSKDIATAQLKDGFEDSPYWQRLCKEKEQLRNKEKQLRKEKEQLREKEIILLRSRETAGCSLTRGCVNLEEHKDAHDCRFADSADTRKTMILPDVKLAKADETTDGSLVIRSLASAKHPYVDFESNGRLVEDIDDWVYASKEGYLGIVVGVAKNGKTFTLESLLPSRIALKYSTARVLFFDAEKFPQDSPSLFFNEFLAQFCNQLKLTVPTTNRPIGELRDLIIDVLEKNPGLDLFVLIDEAHFPLKNDAMAREFTTFLKSLCKIGRLHVAITATSLLFALFHLSRVPTNGFALQDRLSFMQIPTHLPTDKTQEVASYVTSTLKITLKGDAADFVVTQLRSAGLCVSTATIWYVCDLAVTAFGATRKKTKSMEYFIVQSAKKLREKVAAELHGECDLFLFNVNATNSGLIPLLHDIAAGTPHTLEELNAVAPYASVYCMLLMDQELKLSNDIADLPLDTKISSFRGYYSSYFQASLADGKVSIPNSSSFPCVSTFEGKVASIRSWIHDTEKWISSSKPAELEATLCKIAAEKGVGLSSKEKALEWSIFKVLWEHLSRHGAAETPKIFEEAWEAKDKNVCVLFISKLLGHSYGHSRTLTPWELTRQLRGHSSFSLLENLVDVAFDSIKAFQHKELALEIELQKLSLAGE